MVIPILPTVTGEQATDMADRHNCKLWFVNQGKYLTTPDSEIKRPVTRPALSYTPPGAA